METYFLGGGCFWCLDSSYRQLRGVTEVTAGYQGGAASTANYEAVCSGMTGHVEVVRVSFDPTEIPCEVILDAYFTMHDPTQLNRQGADVGTQYRSVMFYSSAEQRSLFEAALARAAKIWGNSIVTALEPAPEFYPAETYHQDFFAKNPNQGYCNAVVLPKMLKVRERFQSYLH